MNILFIADFFADEIPGGGELNNAVLIGDLLRKNKVKAVKSSLCTPNFVQSWDGPIIVANFVQLSENCKAAIIEHGRYFIYEHDHKYLITRDPSQFPDFNAPKGAKINVDFYNWAVTVFCQSKLHADVVSLNMPEVRVVNLGGSLWSDWHFELLRKYVDNERTDCYSILRSSNPVKGFPKAHAYVLHNKLSYFVINECPVNEFFSQLSECGTLVFIPTVLETLNRVVVEARMLGCKVITQGNMIGAFSEDWISMKGRPLIDFMEREKRPEILKTVLGRLDAKI